MLASAKKDQSLTKSNSNTCCRLDKRQLRFELYYTIKDKGLCSLHTDYLLHLLKQSTLYVNKHTTGSLYYSLSRDEASGSQLSLVNGRG